MKDKLNEQNLNKFVGLRVKINSYLKGNNDEDKKAKGTKKCYKKNVNLKIIRTVYKQLKLKIKII